MKVNSLFLLDSALYYWNKNTDKRVYAGNFDGWGLIVGAIEKNWMYKVALVFLWGKNKHSSEGSIQYDYKIKFWFWWIKEKPDQDWNRHDSLVILIICVELNHTLVLWLILVASKCNMCSCYLQIFNYFYDVADLQFLLHLILYKDVKSNYTLCHDIFWQTE